MHHKKRKIFSRLHSIPIHLREKLSKFYLCKKEKLFLVSYSIPLGCMVALLLLGLVILNPSNALKTNAITIQDEWVVKNDSPNKEKQDERLHDTVATDRADNYSIMPLAGDQGAESNEDNINPTTLSLTISNDDQVVQAVQGGNTVYGSYGVTLIANNIKDYTLSIKSDSINLTPPSGTSTIISGANNKTGSSLNNNTWGYAITDTSSNNTEELTYKSLSTTETSLISGSASYSLSENKKLVFAAKFGDDAAPGLYKGNITLSLSATPAQTGQVWSNGRASFVNKMQKISSGFCKDNVNIKTGDTITLQDSRDNNYYKIVKLKDGNCWMQENLRLGGSSSILLSTNDTNITSNYILPASSDSSWNTSDYTIQQMRVGKTGMTVSSSYAGDGKGWQSTYGNYYSWCAATAGTCSETTGNNVNVSGSICPKGWHLPSGGSTSATSGGVGTDSEFYKLFNGLNMSTITTSPYNFPAAGFIYSDGLRGPGTNGAYWSRTSYDSSDAYRLYFYSSYFYPGTSNFSRYYGFSVRCVTDY